MDLIFEIIIELIGELFCEGFVALHSFFIPKSSSLVAKKVFKIISICIAFLLLFALFAGFYLTIDTSGKSPFGWLLLAISAAYFITGVIMAIINNLRKKKKDSTD